MKVLHVSTPRTWRGGEQQLAYLIGELAAMGVQNRVFTPEGSAVDRYCTEHVVPHTTFRRRSSLDFAGAAALSRLARETGADLLHAHDSHAHTLVCLAASFFGMRAPAVVSRRVDFPVRGALSRWKYNHRSVKAVLCVSEEIRRVMLPAVADPSRLIVVHSGIDTEKFPKEAEGRLRREYGIPPERPIVANVAAIAPHKDYPTFVRAAELMTAEGCNAQFLIIGGDGGEERLVRDMIAERGLSERILLTGFRDDIPEVLPEIDLLMFTSKTEGLGTTILDAFAAGTPVVAAAGGGIPEIVLHERTGLLVPVGDPAAMAAAARRVLDDSVLRDRLVRNAREFVADFSRTATAQKTLDVYRDVLC